MNYRELSWYFPFFQGLFLGVVAMVLHECAHIAAATALGVKVKGVGIKWNKGLYTVREQGPVQLNLLIALAGPLMNIVLISLWYWSPDFGLANLSYAVCNLFPFEGSDGARILDCLKQMRKRGLMI
jgi:Zn-dependent protease